MAQNKNCDQIFDIMSAFKIQTVKLQFFDNWIKRGNIMKSKHDIKNLTVSSYSVSLKTPETKLEVISPKNVERDTF